MIRSCKDTDTQKLVNREFCKRFSAIEKSARMRLDRLNAATSLKDLAIPGHNLNKLEGDREGQYSIRINDQYRVCFEWKNGDAINVEVVDYHLIYARQQACCRS
jgi:toxin HigB-1